MSWEIVNQILGLATVDKAFAQMLLEDPLAAAQSRGFHLTDEEQSIFSQASMNDLHELSQYLMRTLQHEYFEQD